MTGQPAISLPLYQSSEGLPIGIMLVGRPAGRRCAARPRGAAGGGPAVGGPPPADLEPVTFAPGAALAADPGAALAAGGRAAFATVNP